MSEQTIGKRFTHIYLVRGEPEKDSAKARFRLAKLAEKSFPITHPSYSSRSQNNPDSLVQEKIENEIGVEFATHGVRSWKRYFEKITVNDMLDTITVLVEGLCIKNEMDMFIAEAQRILKEENLAYKIDDVGGLHPFIDSAFSTELDSVISFLNDTRHAASAEYVNRIDGFLLQSPQDFMGAIRVVFGACENTFKLMYNVPRLDAKTAENSIGCDQQKIYKNNGTLQRSSAKILTSFKQWVDAVHFYRHEQGKEELSQPAEEIAILLISQGLSFVRWLAMLDRKKDNI